MDDDPEAMAEQLRVAARVPVPDRRLVIVESPYAGDIEQNVAYARECMADCLRRGEAPIASHLLYTQPGVLDDEVPEERRLGMEAGWAWFRAADAVVVYMDLGISKGMAEAVKLAGRMQITTELRRLPSTPPPERRPA
jgi:hypothetical protein